MDNEEKDEVSRFFLSIVFDYYFNQVSTECDLTKSNKDIRHYLSVDGKMTKPSKIKGKKGRKSGKNLQNWNRLLSFSFFFVILNKMLKKQFLSICQKCG